ncbi:MAG: hypothetical protein AAB453_02895 [Patescibacteria group bacterium]
MEKTTKFLPFRKSGEFEISGVNDSGGVLSSPRVGVSRTVLKDAQGLSLTPVIINFASSPAPLFNKTLVSFLFQVNELMLVLPVNDNSKISPSAPKKPPGIIPEKFISLLLSLNFGYSIQKLIID